LCLYLVLPLPRIFYRLTYLPTKQYQLWILPPMQQRFITARRMVGRTWWAWWDRTGLARHSPWRRTASPAAPSPAPSRTFQRCHRFCRTLVRACAGCLLRTATQHMVYIPCYDATILDARLFCCDAASYLQHYGARLRPTSPTPYCPYAPDKRFPPATHTRCYPKFGRD